MPRAACPAGAKDSSDGGAEDQEIGLSESGASAPFAPIIAM